MITRSLQYIVVLILGLLMSQRGVSAATYTPAPEIYMTGSNADVRFDVADVLHTTTTSAPKLLVTSPSSTSSNFSGAFYIRETGWVLFATGSYQVKLSSCAVAVNPCPLTGTGWSDTVGEIGFSGVKYNPTTGKLTGTGTSYAGDISLDSIMLPLLSAQLTATTVTANHQATLTISGNTDIYSGTGGGWKIMVFPTLSTDYQYYTSTDNKTFTVDLSLATAYEVKITDPNGSIIDSISLTVDPDIPNKTLNSSINSTIAHNFCIANPINTKCPDGYTRTATTLTQISTTTPVANGSDPYNFTLKVRDQYGNRVDKGSMKIEYESKTNNIQTSNNTALSTSNSNAFMPGSSWMDEGSDIYSQLYDLSLLPLDKSYLIQSSAPTGGTNIIHLNKLTYFSPIFASYTITLPSGYQNLTFNPPYTVAITSDNTPEINTPFPIKLDITKNGGGVLGGARVITTLDVGNNSTQKWIDTTMSSGNPCSPSPFNADICDNWNWSNSPIVIAGDISSLTTLTLTGTYTGTVTPPTSTTVNTYISYTIGSTTTVLYPSATKTLNGAEPENTRLKVIGLTGESFPLSTSARSTLLNQLREQSALLSRNRTDFTNADYMITGSDISIDNSSFTNKSTIVSIGGDISITGDILKRNHPLAIIALTDTQGHGGNITISGSVTDIHGTLIAEHAITSSPVGINQLYIHGSLISANPPTKEATMVCPYFDTGCTPENYDLPDQRGITGLKSTGGSAYNKSLVIEYDTRLISDPPPVLRR